MCPAPTIYAFSSFASSAEPKAETNALILRAQPHLHTYTLQRKQNGGMSRAGQERGKVANQHTQRERASTCRTCQVRHPRSPASPIAPARNKANEKINLGTFGVQDNLSTNVEGCSRSFVRCSAEQPPFFGGWKKKRAACQAAYLAHVRGEQRRRKRRELCAFLEEKVYM